MKHKNRLFLIPLVLFLLVYGYSAATAAPMGHHHRPHWTPGCNTRIHTMKIYSHGAGHVADMYESGSICWNRKGLLTSSSVYIGKPQNTIAGHLTLLRWAVTQPLYRFNGNGVQFNGYEKRFQVHPCLSIPYIGSVCTHTATFAVDVDNYAPSITPQHPHKGFTAFMLPYCTNDWCAKSGHLTFK